MALKTIDRFAELYSHAFPAKRTGALYSACSYPTKISPESIAIFIAAHTNPGDTVLDVFAGSGTTGLAGHLCARPTPEVIDLAEKLRIPVKWGPRHVVLQEIGVWGAFISQVMCNAPDPLRFETAARALISKAREMLDDLYAVSDPDGNEGTLRFAIWSDVLKCPNCQAESSLWDASVCQAPLSMATEAQCPSCGEAYSVSDAERTTETYFDPLLTENATRRKRVLKRIYGRTGDRHWWRPATPEDQQIIESRLSETDTPKVPLIPIPWGDLYRSGYHHGISHLHHFYTPRNLQVVSSLWQMVDDADPDLRDSLKLLVLSYNASHSTLMTRVVVKNGQKDFVVTGAQSGVLYVSGLPVEKNILDGLARKVKTFTQAFHIVHNTGTTVDVRCASSTKLALPDKSVDYVFTDPPFGDFIPYSEISFLNEAWLGTTTTTEEEAIVSRTQNKTVDNYGSLLSSVFGQVSRVLKDDGQATVVFHAAKASVWSALQEAYEGAGLHVALSGVLDKLQTSFKQTNSLVKVQGDPLLLLSKTTGPVSRPSSRSSIDAVIQNLWHRSQDLQDEKERTPERLYSRFVNRYLADRSPVPIDASRFYARLEQIRRTEE